MIFKIIQNVKGQNNNSSAKCLKTPIAMLKKKYRVVVGCRFIKDFKVGPTHDPVLESELWLGII